MRLIFFLKSLWKQESNHIAAKIYGKMFQQAAAVFPSSASQLSYANSCHEYCFMSEQKMGDHLRQKSNVEFHVINLQHTHLTCQQKLLRRKEYSESQFWCQQTFLEGRGRCLGCQTKWLFGQSLGFIHKNVKNVKDSINFNKT